MTLTEFLLAQIAEDEAVAQRPTGRVYTCDDGHVQAAEDEWADGSDRLPNHHNTWTLIHDPARVLAECEAKRRIVSRCDLLIRGPEIGAFSGAESAHGWDILRALATVYASHPDYREEWRP